MDTIRTGEFHGNVLFMNSLFYQGLASNGSQYLNVAMDAKHISSFYKIIILD